MGKKLNPAVIGAFVVASIVLVVAGLVVFGKGKILHHTKQWVLYFDESVKGLSVGAPVMFKGVKIGSVTDVKVVVERATVTIRTPVFVEVDADRFTDAAGGDFRFQVGAADIELLIDRGLRAQLELQSLVTGLLAVALDFHPGAPLNLANVKGGVPEFPTIPSATAKLQRTLEELPIKDLLDSALELTQSMRRLVDGPELRGAIVSIGDTARDMRTLVPELKTAIGSMTDAARDIRALARTVDGRVAPVASGLETTLGDAQLVLRTAERAFSTVEAAATEKSTLRYQIAGALGEVTGAMRSVRFLTEYLGRHPEALLRGKGGPE
jgi:paraquat-inducible protein B